MSETKHHNDSDDLRILEGPEGVRFSIHVQPKASRNEILGVSGNELKVRLTSPPVDGAANRLCQEFLAKLFRVSKSSVRIVSGEKSRHKVVAISGTTREAVAGVLSNDKRRKD